MSSRLKKRTSGRNDQTRPVAIDALKLALPIFWPVRTCIWSIHPMFIPAYIFVSGHARAIGAMPLDQAFHDGLIQLENAFSDISKIRPTDAGAIFIRLWWLAAHVDGTPFERISDLLVQSGQTSPTWDAVLTAAATIRGKNSDRLIDPDLFTSTISQFMPAEQE